MSHPYISIISDYAPTFRAETQGLTYIRRGVFWSELLAFAAMAKHAGAQRVVESGTGLGFSCRVLARLFPSVVTIGLEDRPADLQDNVTFVQGDAWDELHKWADDTCAVLIDGPKHEEAVTLAQETDFAAVIGVHDCALGMPARPLLKQAFPGMFFTDDIDYAEPFMPMDAECFAMAEKNGKRFPTYGPTMGIICL